jgi:outer membrane immunogenic protein
MGYAMDRVLVYATAGGAGGNVRTALSGLPLQNHAEFGWTAGGGIEVALADNWTAKLEYLFVDLSNTSCNQASACGFDVPAALLPPTAPIGSNNGVRFDENIVRVGVNFIFRP